MDESRPFHPMTRKSDGYFKTLLTALANLIRQGLSAPLIAEKLNNAGIPSHSGRPWTPEMIYSVLVRFRNAKYSNQARTRAYALMYTGHLNRADVDIIMNSKGLSCHH